MRTRFAARNLKFVINADAKTFKQRARTPVLHFDTDENRPAKDVIEQIIANGLRHPLRRPTIQFPEARRRETETFQKSTYASGDAGIPGESQR